MNEPVDPRLPMAVTLRPRQRAGTPWRAGAALVAVCALAAMAAPQQLAAQASRPAAAAAPAAPPSATIAPRTTSIPARGLFKGDQLSESTKARLVDLIIDALGLDIEVALIVPTGPWQIDGAGHTERDLNEARLKALRTFLTERGIESKRIFVESRVDAKVSEPRLDVQLIGRPSGN